MEACADDAVGGLNAYIHRLPDKARVSLTTFDSESIDLIRDAVLPAEAALKPSEFIPRGGTPLHDAIGLTVAQAEKRSVGSDRVALVILTDGYENASRLFERKAILELLKRKQEGDGWLVIYLGANQDAWAVGERFGTVADNSMSVGDGKFGEAMLSVERATRSYYSSGDKQLGRRMSGFSRQERDRAMSGSR
jgi:hypothetical protein